MIEACEGQRETAMWLVCDQATHRKVRPRLRQARADADRAARAQRLSRKGTTLAELATQAGIDAAGLEATVREYNRGAVHGEDAAVRSRQRHRSTATSATPSTSPIRASRRSAQGPYYALKVVMGDLGTFDGLATNVVGEVLRRDGTAIPGLYAVGNDRAEHHGRQLPRRRHHARAEHDLRLHHGAGTWRRRHSGRRRAGRHKGLRRFVRRTSSCTMHAQRMHQRVRRR